MSADNLQELIDKARPGDTLTLDPPNREFRGPLVIRHGVTLVGQGATIWAPKGPVIRIEAGGTSLSKMNVEVTSRDPLEGEAACALQVTTNLPVSLHDVTVRGNVMGLDREEGVWRCPRSLALGELRAGSAHEFRVQLGVPARCVIESEIDGLHVQPRELLGDPVTLALRLDALAAGTRLRGRLRLRTALLTRHILVTASFADGAAGVGDGRVIWSPTGVPTGMPAPAPRTQQVPRTLPVSPPPDFIPSLELTPTPTRKTVAIEDPPSPLLGDTEPVLAPSVPMAPSVPPVSSAAELTVSQDGDTPYGTVGEAIRVARTGARIRIRPGVYREGLLLDRNVELIGEGAAEEIVIEASDANALRLQTDTVRARGLTLRSAAGKSARQRYAVFVPHGRLILEDCQVSSDSLACVAAAGQGAALVMRNCSVRGGKSAGVLLLEKAEAEIENCEITGCALAGVESRQGAQVMLRSCKIQGSAHVGVLVHEKGVASLEDCDISENALANVEVRAGSNPVFRRCKIHDGKAAGVLVHDNGRGEFQECELFGNALANLEVRRGGHPVLRNCRLYDGKHTGALFVQDAQGELEDCTLQNNALAGVEIRRGANPTLKRCKVQEGADVGMAVRDKGLGTLEECVIADSTRAAVELSQGAAPTLTRCKIQGSKVAGVVAVGRGGGTLEECEIADNRGPGLAVTGLSSVTLKGCTLRDNDLAGAVFWGDGKGVLENCEISGNGMSGLAVFDGGEPTLKDCRLTANADHGVWADGGGGTLQKCDLTGNREGPLDVAAGCDLRVENCVLGPSK